MKLRGADSSRRLRTQFSPPAPAGPLPPSTLFAAPPAEPAPGLWRQRSAPAPRICARSREGARARNHPRSLLTHFKVHSQNSQTFSAQRGELGREGESLSLPSPPLGDRGPVARPESATASISPRTRRMCGEGWAKGDGSREARRHCEGWGGSREEEGRGFNSGFTLFQIGV